MAKRLGPLSKVVAGLVALAGACALGLGLEAAKRDAAGRTPSVLWALPQYALAALSAVLVCVSSLELAYAGVPAPLRALFMALFFMAASLPTLVRWSIPVLFGYLLPNTPLDSRVVPYVLGIVLVPLVAMVARWSRRAATYCYRQDRGWDLLDVPADRRSLAAESAALPGDGGPRSAGDGAGERESFRSRVMSGMFVHGPDAAFSLHATLEACIIKFSLLKMGSVVAAGGSGQVNQGAYAGSPVAIKSVYSQMINPEYVEEVLHEARMLAAVRHPHITAFLGVSLYESRLLLVTEWVPYDLDLAVHAVVKASRRAAHAAVGAAAPPSATKPRSPQARTPPRHSADREPRLPPHGGLLTAPAVWRLMDELAQTLEYLHGLGIVHRDLKPSNVLLARSDRTESGGGTLGGALGAYHVKVCDLGMARLLERGGTRHVTTGVGTPAFMPPEAAKNLSAPSNARADAANVAVGGGAPREAVGGRIPSTPARWGTPRAESAAGLTSPRAAAFFASPMTPSEERAAAPTAPPVSYATVSTTAAPSHSAMPQHVWTVEDLPTWDIYSLGVVFWFMWYLQEPFDGRRIHDIVASVSQGERPPFPRDVVIPRALRDLIESMWMQTPGDRPNAARVLVALNAPALGTEIQSIGQKGAAFHGSRPIDYS